MSKIMRIKRISSDDLNRIYKGKRPKTVWEVLLETEKNTKNKGV